MIERDLWSNESNLGFYDLELEIRMLGFEVWTSNLDWSGNERKQWVATDQKLACDDLCALDVYWILGTVNCQGNWQWKKNTSMRKSYTLMPKPLHPAKTGNRIWRKKSKIRGNVFATIDQKLLPSVGFFPFGLMEEWACQEGFGHGQHVEWERALHAWRGKMSGGNGSNAS